MNELNKDIYGKARRQFVLNLEAALQKEEEPMKRKISYTIALAVLLVLLLATAGYAIIKGMNFADSIEWDEKGGFPGKYLAVGIYMGEDGMPWFEEKRVVALYDPIDLNGKGPGIIWQGYWNEAENRNATIQEIGNPVFLVAEYAKEKLIDLEEVSEEAFELLRESMNTKPSEERIALRAAIENAYSTYMKTAKKEVFGVADENYGPYITINYPDSDDIDGVYLLTNYKDGKIEGFVEISEEAFLAIMEKWQNKGRES